MWRKQNETTLPRFAQCTRPFISLPARHRLFRFRRSTADLLYTLLDNLGTVNVWNEIVGKHF
jgi:hypothetical protein